MKTKNKFLKVSLLFMLIGIFLLSFIFFNISISTILFIFKVSIKCWYTPLSILFSSILILYILKIKKLLNFKSIMLYLCIIIPVFIIGASAYFSAQYYDSTGDGNSYHKTIIGAMAHGYNPVYEKIENCDYFKENNIKITKGNALYSNHYANASHVFAADMASFTGRIESGKCINIISLFILLFFILLFALNKSKDIIFSILLSVAVCSCVPILSQIFTNYIGCLVYVFMFLTIYCFISLEYWKDEKYTNFKLEYVNKKTEEDCKGLYSIFVYWRCKE